MMNSEISKSSPDKLNNSINLNEDFDKEKQYSKHPWAHKNGGFHMNFIEDTNVMAIVGAVVKQIGQKVARGDFNLAVFAKPVQLTYPMTMLEALSNDFTYSSTYLNLASQCKDPLLRMQYVVLSTLSGVHVNQSILHSQAPIDCLLGETIQIERPDGSRFYAEYVKQYPPTYLLQLYGPNDDYTVYSSDEIFAEIHPTFTEVIGRTPRKRYIKFRDGKIFEIAMPTMIIEGLLNGDRILNFMDSYTITSVEDNLTAKISFSYLHQGKITKITKKFTRLWNRAKEVVPNDLVSIEIIKNVMVDEQEMQFTLASGSGVWLSYIQFDGKVMWRWDDPFLSWRPLQQQQLLPSDSSLRSDRSLILQDKMDEAQKWRNQMEDDDVIKSKLRKQKK